MRKLRPKRERDLPRTYSWWWRQSRNWKSGLLTPGWQPKLSSLGVNFPESSFSASVDRHHLGSVEKAFLSSRVAWMPEVTILGWGKKARVDSAHCCCFRRKWILVGSKPLT